MQAWRDERVYLACARMSQTAEPLQQEDRVFVRWRGRRLLYFAGCD